MTFFVKKIFGQNTAFWFLPIMLMEPFTLVTGMQTRPENFALLLLSVFLIILYYALKSQSAKKIFLSGIFLTLTFFGSLKLLPAVLMIILGLSIYCFLNNKKRLLLYFFDGLIAAFFLLFLFFYFSGNMLPAFQQLLLDPLLLNMTIPISTPFNFFYMIESSLLFGKLGRPITWIWALVLPMAAFAASYKVFLESIINNVKSGKYFFYLGLSLAFFVTWISMLFINSVWMQYYLPLTWFYCLFTAVLINDIQTNIKIKTAFRQIFTIIMIIFLIMVGKTTYEGNLVRSTGSNTIELQNIETLWKIVPLKEKTFPNILFRLPAYPIIYGGTLAPYMIERFGPVYRMLQKNNVNIITAEENYIRSLDKDSQNYIFINFKKDSPNPIIWRRIIKSI